MENFKIMGINEAGNFFNKVRLNNKNKWIVFIVDGGTDKKLYFKSFGTWNQIIELKINGFREFQESGLQGLKVGGFKDEINDLVSKYFDSDLIAVEFYIM